MVAIIEANSIPNFFVVYQILQTNPAYILSLTHWPLAEVNIIKREYGFSGGSYFFNPDCFNVLKLIGFYIEVIRMVVGASPQ
jgi:hypothetical protein